MNSYEHDEIKFEGNFAINPYVHESRIVQLAKPIGYWCLYDLESYNIMFSMYQKPTDEQIKNTEELLGWKWKNADNEQR